jgi:hypothetical protein
MIRRLNMNDNRSTGLIFNYDLSIDVGTKKIHICAETRGSSTMNQIGINNIHIQRSSDNSYFYDEKTTSSDYAYSASYYKRSDYPVSVLGGFYYRVVLDHYAYNGSTSESINHTSNSVWIA